MKKGELFICSGCWIDLDARWNIYFLERSDRYEAVFKDGGGPAISKGDKPFEGCFSIAVGKLCRFKR